VVNLQQPTTPDMSLHYLVKYLCSKNRNAQEVVGVKQTAI